MRRTTMLEARPTLVVVDCQKCYLRRSADEAINRILDHFAANVRHIIEVAKNDGKTIVFIEQEGSGDILPDIREAARWGRIAFMMKNRNDVLDPSSAYYPLNLPMFAPLVGCSAVVEAIGVQAGLCVAGSVAGMRREGILCRALAHGIINHTAHVSEANYRESNDLEKLKRIFGDPDRLDLSRVGSETNLADLHTRIYAERFPTGA